MEIATVQITRDMNRPAHIFWTRLQYKHECLAEMNDWPTPYYARYMSDVKTDREGIHLATFSIHTGEEDEDDKRRKI